MTGMPAARDEHHTEPAAGPPGPAASSPADASSPRWGAPAATLAGLVAVNHFEKGDE